MASQVGLSLNEIVTPAFLVDKSKVKKHCDAAIESCKKLGIKLRGHTKTHKTIEGADLVTNGTRKGLVCSTLAECEFFAKHNCDDIIYGIPLVHHHFKRAYNLTRDLETFHVMIDSLEIAEKLSETAPPSGKKWSVILALDTGADREGILWDDFEVGVKIAKCLKSSATAEFKGMYAHCGSTYEAKSPEELQTLQNENIDRLLTCVESLKAQNIECEIYGIGSTPTISHPSPNLKKLTEVHPGNFIFYDVQQSLMGCCTFDDIAVNVATRVIGHHPGKNHMLTDCGFTALTQQGFGATESGYAVIKGEPNLKYFSMNQEIGYVSTIDGSKINFEKYPLGSMLHLYPYHACATSNQHGTYLVMENEIVKEEWKPVHGW